jgi:hypothetical protein
MSNDITRILEDWDFELDQVTVRVIKGDDGREKVQLRVDLGLLQMEMDGRPDGTRPEGFVSWLEYYEHRQRAYDAAHPDSAPFTLDEEDCIRLWREGLQFYHRYLSFWHLGRYDLCARDTQRNLRLFAFVRAHGAEDRFKLQFDQWRPYVIMMHTRAVATPLLNRRRYRQGLQAIEAGIDAIHEFLDEYDQGERAAECGELVSLERWREEILDKKEQARTAYPKSAVRVLRQKLEAAVAAEEFEEAARLRDEIRRLAEKEGE